MHKNGYWYFYQQFYYAIYVSEKYYFPRMELDARRVPATPDTAYYLLLLINAYNVGIKAHIIIF